MVNEARGRLFRRKDGKFLIYLPKDFAEDSMFPFKDFGKGKRGSDSIYVKVSFAPSSAKKLLVDEWKETKSEG